MIGEQEITVTPLTNQDKYPDKNWHAAQAGNYKLVFDLNNRTLTATLLKSFIETSGLYLIRRHSRRMGSQRCYPAAG